jgi:hypothetical protein
MSTANVRVAIRIRPLTSKERMEDGNGECITLLDGGRQLVIGKNHSFSFDNIFDAEASQRLVYESTVIHLIDKFMDGYNATIFAYGQVKSAAFCCL